MKKLMLICALVLGISAMSYAQGGRQRQSPAEQSKTLQTQLKLTDDQTAKVTAILTASAAKMDSLRTAGADRSAMMPIRQEQQAKIAALLTDEQKAAYKKIQEEMRARMQQGGGNPPPPPSPPQK